jgi:hypothetical protein
VTDYNENAAGATPPGRVPGRYVVYVLGVCGVIFLAFVIVLAVRLEPAADRFHNPPPATPKN